jgi:hypothetical protein
MPWHSQAWRSKPDIVDQPQSGLRLSMRFCFLKSQSGIAMDEIHYKDWRIEVLPHASGWKALVYRPSSPLHEATVPREPDRRSVIAEAKALIDRNQGT